MHGSAVRSPVVRCATRRFASTQSTYGLRQSVDPVRKWDVADTPVSSGKPPKRPARQRKKQQFPPRKLDGKDHKTLSTLFQKDFVPRVAQKSKAGTVPLESYMRFRESMRDQGTSFDTNGEVEDDITWGNQLNPGTYIEMRRANEIIHGIVLDEVLKNGSRKYAVLTADGSLVDFNVDQFVYTTPGFVSSSLAARCGLSFPDCSSAELSARTKVLMKLRELDLALEKAAVAVHGQTKRMYETVKSSDPNTWAQVTVSEALRLWTKDATMVNHHVTQRALLADSLHFVMSPDFSVSSILRVRPQSHVDRILKVQEWYREPNNPIFDFTTKAKGIIAKNQESIQQSLSNVESPSQSPADHSWTENDQVIITYLMESLRPLSGTQDDPYTHGRNYIIKGLLDEAEIDDTCVLQILVNLGVFAPWQDPIIVRPDLDQLFDNMKPKQDVEIVQRSLSARPPEPSQVLGPEDLYPSDPLDSVRHDWGDARVFVIDDAGAEELDDGVSVEPVLNESGKYWVHVHIADLASLIPPTHILANRAQKTGETLYLLHETLPLFPHELTRDPKTGRSLNATGTQQPVMTFSTKVDLHGQVHDIKVRAGFIKNVNCVTYDSVDAALGLPMTKRTYPFGDVPKPRTTSPISPDHIPDLQLLHRITQGFIKKRFDDGIFVLARDRPTIVDFSLPSHLSSPTFEPTRFRGFAEMKYAVSNVIDEDTGSRSVVAEAMKLACRTASQFSVEHNIPAVRRFSTEPFAHSPSAQQALLDLRSPNGYVRFEQGVVHLAMDGKTGYSVDPLAHHFLGIQEGVGYTRATSPLRRYLDLVHHWQIGAALLGKKTPFSKEWMESYAVQLKTQERFRRRGEGQHLAWWQIAYIERFLSDPARREGRPNPFENLTGSVVQVTDTAHGTSAHFMCHKIGLKAISPNFYPKRSYAYGETVSLELDRARLGVTPGLLVKLRE